MDFTKCLLATETELFLLFVRIAKQLKLDFEYDNNNYLWIKGTSNIALTSHVDTVDYEYGGYNFRFGRYAELYDTVKQPALDLRSPKEIKIEKGIVTAYRDGNRAILGGDDRVGVHIIYRILEDYFKGNLEKCPHVLLFNGEECGGIGVDKFVSTKPDLSAIDLILSIDCAHTNQFVWYGRNRSADKWVESFGWSNKGHGVFSDITIIGEYVNIPSVNLGCGYYNQHSTSEYVDVEVMEMTKRKVFSMLKEGYVPAVSSVNCLDDDWEKHVYLCCKDHGCYYGEDLTCPVANGLLEQIAPCEVCHDEKVKYWESFNWDGEIDMTPVSINYNR